MKKKKSVAVRVLNPRRSRNFAQLVAASTGWKTKDVRTVVEKIFQVAAEQMRKSGSVNMAGMLNLKLKAKPATGARRGTNPFTKKPFYFHAKPASHTVKATALKKLKTMVNPLYTTRF